MEQIQKWVRWTLSQYNLHEGFADNFWLDGTSMCMLSKQDMVCRSSHAGEYLYAELDVWKNGEQTISDIIIVSFLLSLLYEWDRSFVTTFVLSSIVPHSCPFPSTFLLPLPFSGLSSSNPSIFAGVFIVFGNPYLFQHFSINSRISFSSCVQHVLSDTYQCCQLRNS